MWAQCGRAEGTFSVLQDCISSISLIWRLQRTTYRGAGIVHIWSQDCWANESGGYAVLGQKSHRLGPSSGGSKSGLPAICGKVQLRTTILGFLDLGRGHPVGNNGLKKREENHLPEVGDELVLRGEQ